MEDVRLWTMGQIESLATSNLQIDDELLREFIIPAVRRKVENWLGEAMITQTRTAYYDAIDLDRATLQLPYGPLQSISSVQYTTSDGSLETFASASYYAMTAKRSQLGLNEGYTWPSDLRDFNSLQVEYVCGYGASAIGTPDFNGTGSNGVGDDELATGGQFCGGADVTYRVTIDSEGTPDTFKVTSNSGVNYTTTEEQVTGEYQHLQMGVYAKFLATTGYSDGDYWDIACTANSVPQHYQAAMLQMVKYVLSADDGFVGERLNQIIETAAIPPAIKLILGQKVRV